MRKLCIILLVLVLLSGCYSSGNDEMDIITAKEESYDFGYEDGFDEGYQEGENEGYERGKQEALEEFERKYELSRDYNSYRDELVYFEFPEEFELTYCEPDGNGEEYLRAIIEKHGFDNEGEEFIAFSTQNLMEFDALRQEDREGFSMDSAELVELMLKDDEDAVCYEYKMINGNYVGILYYDENGDKAVDITKYQILKDGVLYYFMYFPDEKQISNKYIMESILKSLELPSLEIVKEYFD